MAVNVGTIVLNVSADNSKLNKDLKKAEKSTKKSFGNMTKHVGAFKIAVVAAFAIVGASTLKIINDFDKINKTASKLGTTTEQLTSLSYAAELAGVSTNTFNMAMQRMVRRSSEAAQGLGEAKNALKELNIDAKSFNNLSLEDKMKKLADAFKQVKSPTDQLRLSFKLFDSEGAALINMLKNGSGEIEKFQRESDKLGKTLKTSVANSASTAADNITKFQASISKVEQELAVKFLPTINGAINKIAQFFDVPGSFSLQDQINEYEKLDRKILEMKKTLDDKKTGEGWATNMANYRVQVERAEIKLAVLKNKIEEAGGSVKDFGEVNLWGQIFKDSDKYAGGQTKITDNLVIMENQLFNNNKEMERFGEIQQSIAEGPGMSKMNEDLMSMYNSLEKSNVNYEVFKQVVNNGEVTKALEEQALAADTVANAIGTGMNNAFDDMLNGSFKWRDAFKDVIGDILKGLFKVLVTQKAINSLSGAFGGSGAVTTTPTAGTVVPHAKGGIVDKPTFFGMSGNSTGLMGEAGPEAIMPLKRSSNGELGVSAAPVNVTVVNNNNSNVSVEQNGDQISILIDNIEKAIAGNINQGRGPVAPAIQNMKNQGKI